MNRIQQNRIELVARPDAYLIGLECDGLLVEVVPGAPEPPGLIPDLLELRVVLDDDGVLDVRALRRLLRVTLGPRGRHSTALKGDIKGGLKKLRLESKTSSIAGVCILLV